MTITVQNLGFYKVSGTLTKRNKIRIFNYETNQWNYLKGGKVVTKREAMSNS